MKVLVEVAAVCVLGTLAFAATSHAAGAGSDPRKCTVAGTAGSPVYCVSRAAKAAVKARMVTRTHNPRWNLPVVCTAEVISQPLRQKCHWLSDHRRASWGAVVVFAQTGRGWTARVTISGPLRQ